MSQFSIAVIKLTGELEIGRRAEIHRALELPAGATAVLLDFTAITYADSTALAQLLQLRNDATAAKVRLAIVTGTENAQFVRLIQYAGLGDAFAVFAERSDALTYLADTQR